MTPVDRPYIHVTYRSEQHSITAAASRILRLLRPHLATGSKIFPEGSPQLKIPLLVKRKCNVKEHRLENIWYYEMSSNSGAHSNEPLKRHRIFYFSGGGFSQPGTTQHWRFCAEISCQVPGLSVNIVSYPLAPKSPAAIALPQLLHFLKAVLEQANGKDEYVSLAGDSAGGNIVLTLALMAAKDMINETACRLQNVLVISPAVDLRNSNPDMISASEKDVILTKTVVENAAARWAGDWPRDTPELSPLLVDLSTLAHNGIKVHGVIGSYDILAPDAVLFHKKLNHDRVIGEWLEWDKQIHCFPLAYAPGFKESQEALRWITDLLRRNCRI